MRDYRTHLLTIAKRAPTTINNTLAAIDDFYTRRGLGSAATDRLDLPTQAPRALDTKAAPRWLRAIQDHPAPRDRVLALLPFYAGLRIAEAVGLDVDDVRLSARKGTLRVHGKGGTPRELPIHPQLRTDLQLWLDERPDWPGAQTTPALLLNRRGGRLSTRGASSIFRAIATTAGLDEAITAHTGRHTFATTLEVGRIASGALFPKIRKLLLPATSPFGLDQGRLAMPRHTHPDQAIDPAVALNVTMLQPILWHPASHSCISCN